MTEGMRKRQCRYLNVPSATIGDQRLSFKARGILAYLLDKPEGWDVRSAAIAADSDGDGKAAVQSGLRELAAAGYYRIERRRLLDGRVCMGTAISEGPVPEWAAEHAEYAGPVPVLQQADGTFQVRRKDGTMTGDGFTSAPETSPKTDVSAGGTGTRFPGAGSAGTGETGAGSAGAAEPGAFITTEEPLPKHEHATPAASHARTAGAARQRERSPRPVTAASLPVTQRARELTGAYAAAEPMCRWPAVNAIVLKAIRTGRWRDEEIRDALLRLAAEGRPVTVDTLRIELQGLPPARPSPQVPRPAGQLPPRNRGGLAPGFSTTDQRVAQAQALKAQLASRHQEPA